MLLQGHEAVLHQLVVLGERLGVDASEHLNHFGGELEGSALELHSFSRGVREEESKVNMHDVPLDINKDVTVMSVLDLEDVAEQRVGSQRLAEVLPRLLVLASLGRAELLLEVLLDVRVLSHFLLDAINTQSISGNFDQTTLLSSGKNLIGLEPQVQLLQLEDLVERADELHGKLLLADVIVRLHNYSKQLPRQEVAEGRVLLDPLFLLLGRLVKHLVLPIFLSSHHTDFTFHHIIPSWVALMQRLTEEALIGQQLVLLRVPHLVQSLVVELGELPLEDGVEETVSLGDVGVDGLFGIIEEVLLQVALIQVH
mmetsp:Transcript_33658/g.51947  ORF Transcript_33658/g.51947 Transcript_33658/m.51947 type:complete len:312 (-) Transcript_33658:3040-3975(-)